MKYLCQFGLNLTLGSEDKSADKAFSLSYMSLVTLKIKIKVTNI